MRTTSSDHRERAASIVTDPTPQTRRWVRLRRDNFIKGREHRRMASYVVDFDEGGGPVDWPQRREAIGSIIRVGKEGKGRSRYWP